MCLNNVLVALVLWVLAVNTHITFFLSLLKKSIKGFLVYVNKFQYSSEFLFYLFLYFKFMKKLPLFSEKRGYMSQGDMSQLRRWIQLRKKCPYLELFSPNAGKCGQKLRTRTLFALCPLALFLKNFFLSAK